MMSISPESGQRPLPSVQKAGHRPSPAVSLIRAETTPYVNSTLLCDSSRPDVKSNARPSGVANPE
jgi:hypothetical protein